MSIDAKALTSWLKKYPTPIICGVLSVALLVTLYLRSDLIDARQAELNEFLSESNRHRANILNSAQLQEQLSFLEAANKAVRDRALTVEGIAQNLQYFYRLESEVGIKYLELRPGTRATSSKSAIYVPLNYVVNVQGDFTQIITYLRRLEQCAYFCRINSAVVTGTGTFVLSLNLDLLGVQ